MRYDEAWVHIRANDIRLWEKTDQVTGEIEIDFVKPNPNLRNYDLDLKFDDSSIYTEKVVSRLSLSGLLDN